LIAVKTGFEFPRYF